MTEENHEKRNEIIVSPIEPTQSQDKASESVDQGLDVARRIWLAGVGAYGRVIHEAQGQFEKVAGAANEMFDELVARGEKVEDKVRASFEANPNAAKLSETVNKATSQAKEAGEKGLHLLEEKFDALKERFAVLNPTKLKDTLADLEARVIALEAALAKKSKPKADA